MSMSMPFNSTHYIMLYPQNSDRIVTVDSVTPLYLMYTCVICRVELGKVFPYSLPSVGPGADPGVQAVSSQVTSSESRHRPGSRLPLLSAGPAVISVAFTRWRYL